jgi:hypothetical protein
LPPARALRNNLKYLWPKDFKHQANDSEKKWFSIARARLQLAFDYYRSDEKYEISNIQLGDLYPILFTLRGDETLQFSFGIGIKQRQSISTVAPTFTKLVRQEDVEICPVGCLAFYLLSLWTVSICAFFARLMLRHSNKHERLMSLAITYFPHYIGKANSP